MKYNLQIVTPDHVRLLRSLGFDWTPMAVNKKLEEYEDLPTVALVLKWLRDTKGIYLVTQPLYDNSDKPKISKYRWWIMPDVIEVSDEIDDREYNSFEEAELSGLYFVLISLYHKIEK